MLELQPKLIVVEATGGYQRSVVDAMFYAGLSVAVVNPVLGDRADLAHVPSAGNHEHVGDADDRTDLEYQGVCSVLGRRSAGGQDAATTYVFRGIPP